MKKKNPYIQNLSCCSLSEFLDLDRLCVFASEVLCSKLLMLAIWLIFIIVVEHVLETKAKNNKVSPPFQA